MATFTLTPTATRTATPTRTPTLAPTATATPTATFTPIPTPVNSAVLYLSSDSSGSVAGLSFAAADILSYNRTVDAWQMVFDGSDVGLTGNVDAFFFESDGSILLSLLAAATLPGAGAVTDADILRFTPAQLGETTAGSFTLLLDGSDVGLDSSLEDIDAVGRTADGGLFVSTSSNFSVPTVGGSTLSGNGSDLLVFAAGSLGDTTAGSWSLLFDGSDAGLGETAAIAAYENVDAAFFDPLTGDLYLAAAGDFTTGGGFGGDLDDILLCAAPALGEETACSYAPYWNGAAHGFAGEDIDGLALAGPLLPPPAPVTLPGVVTDTLIYLNALGGSAGGLTFTGADLLAYDTASGRWSFHFDGSDVGIVQTTVDGFALEGDGSLLLSLAYEQTLPGVGLVDDADVVRFTPTTWGLNTTGVFTMVLDGSDVGLDSVSENIDAVGRTPDGRLLVSVSGGFNAGAVGGDEDLFVFDAVQLGDDSAGSWSLYFDGSDIDLSTGASEDIDGVWVDPLTGYLYLGTAGDFAAGFGLGGDKNDIFVCAPASLGEQTACALALFWDGGAHGLAGGNLRSFTLVPAAGVVGMAGAGARQPGLGVPAPGAAGGPPPSLHLPYIAAGG